MHQNKNRWIKRPEKFRLFVFLPLIGLYGLLEAAPDPKGNLIGKVGAQREEALPSAKPREGGDEFPSVEKDPNADDSPLGVDLSVIRLLAHQGRVDLEATFRIAAPVMVDPNLNLPEGLAAGLEADYLGKPVSESALEGVIKDIINAYRATDYPLVDAYLPEQNITGGKLQIVIREAVLGEVTVEGAKHSKPEYLLKQIRARKGERINGSILGRDIDWLNTNLGRRVDLVYERGADDGTSDVILKTDDLYGFAAYTSFGNTGVAATGLEEWAAGFNLPNILGTEQSFGYNFGSDYDLDNLYAHSIVYEVPFPWRHRLQFIGAYVLSNTTGGGGLGVDGESIQTSIDYKMYPPMLFGKHRQNLSLGWDFKSTNTDILFGGESVSATSAEVFQYRIGYDVTLDDDHGYTRFDAGFAYSPGDITGGNNDTDFDALRAGSTAHYHYYTGGVERYVTLPAEFALILRANGQIADDRLISTEQILAGGYRSVRGLDENVARGDSGWTGSVELHAPPFSLSKMEGEKFDKNSLYAFYDSARLYSSGSLAAEPDQGLDTLGLGLNCRLGEHASLRTSYGWVLDSSGVNNPGSGKFHFGLTVSF